MDLMSASELIICRLSHICRGIIMLGHVRLLNVYVFAPKVANITPHHSIMDMLDMRINLIWVREFFIADQPFFFDWVPHKFPETLIPLRGAARRLGLMSVQK